MSVRSLTFFPCSANAPDSRERERRPRAHVHSATIQPECQARLQHLRHVGALRRRGRRLLQTRAERARGKACESCRNSGYRAEGDAVRSLADECAAPFCSHRCYPAHAPHRRWQRTARSRRAAEPHEAATLPSDGASSWVGLRAPWVAVLYPVTRLSVQYACGRLVVEA